MAAKQSSPVYSLNAISPATDSLNAGVKTFSPGPRAVLSIARLYADPCSAQNAQQLPVAVHGNDVLPIPWPDFA